MDKAYTSYKMEERSYGAYIKREIHNQIARSRFSEKQKGEIDLIVAEITSNIIKHAGSGEILFKIQEDDDVASVFEIIAIDGGPGISDLARMLRDGVSTTQTLGHGLGSIHRLSSLAQIYSIPGWGTILYSTVRSPAKITTVRKALPATVDIRALCVNKPRELVCGDGYRVKRTNTDITIFLGDGLGHGERAKEAVDTAGDFFFESKETNPVEIIRQMHQNIRRTRGLVGTIAHGNFKTRQWQICGVGNIFTRIYNGLDFKNYMPYNGTIGLTLPTTMNATILPMETNQLVIMCSDGIQTRWDLSRYPSILKYDTTVLAAAIYKDYTRANDDASVLIAKVL